MISIPGRIPIHITPFFWLLIAMIGWLNSGSIIGTAIWCGVIFISVLIHEYGHALTALVFGQTAEINLVGLGGVTRRSGPKLDRWKEIFIVLNGPLAGFALCFIAYLALGMAAGKTSPLLIYSLQVAVQVNLFWTILNLLPILPLDGGHLLRLVLEGFFGLRGLKIALFLGILFASVLGLYFFVIQQILMGALFFMFAFESYRAWSEVKGIAIEDIDQELHQCVREGAEDLQAGRVQEALTKFNEVRRQAPKGMLYVTATQYAARALAEQGNLREAYLLLYPLKNRLPLTYVDFLQQLAYRVEEWEQVIEVGQIAYQQHPSIDTALLNACASAILGEVTPAVGWLRSAVKLGAKDIQTVIARREFDAIRESDPFRKFVLSYKV